MRAGRFNAIAFNLLSSALKAISLNDNLIRAVEGDVPAALTCSPDSSPLELDGLGAEIGGQRLIVAFLLLCSGGHGISRGGGSRNGRG